MKKKIVIGVIAILVIVIVAGAYYLLSNLNSLVAGAIEKHGSDVTDTSVGVSGVEISLREGRGSIKGLTVASPDGFEAKDAFSLGDITIDIDLKSIREDPVVIEEILVRAPVINAEFNGNGASNIDELRKQVLQPHASDASGGGGENGSGGETTKIRIKKFVFEQGRIEVDASALGLEKRTIILPEIRLNDIGGADGASPEKIAEVVLTTITKRVVAELKDSEIDRLIRDQLGDSAADKAKNLLKNLKN